MFVVKSPSCVSRIVQVAVHHSHHCIDDARCEDERTIRGDNPLRIALFQRKKCCLSMKMDGSRTVHSFTILNEVVDLSGVCQKLPATPNEGFAEVSGILGPEEDLIRYQALAGSEVASRPTSIFQHDVLPLYSERRLLHHAQ